MRLAQGQCRPLKDCKELGRERKITFHLPLSGALSRPEVYSGGQIFLTFVGGDCCQNVFKFISL